jgi:hypothetical protein
MKRHAMRIFVLLTALAIVPALSVSQGITKRAAPNLIDQAARDSITQNVRPNLTELYALDAAKLESLAVSLARYIATMDSIAQLRAAATAGGDTSAAHLSRLNADRDSILAIAARIAWTIDSNSTQRGNLTTLFAWIATVRDSGRKGWDTSAVHKQNISDLSSAVAAIQIRDNNQSDSLKTAATRNALQSDSLKTFAERNATQSDSLKTATQRNATQSDSLKAAAQVNASQSDSLKTVATRNGTQSDSLKAAAVENAVQSDSLRRAFVAIAETAAALRASQAVPDTGVLATQWDLNGVKNLTGTTIDWSLAPQFKDTLTGNTVYAFTNVTAGSNIRVWLVNVSGRLNPVSWPSNVYWTADGALTVPSVDTLYTVRLEAFASDYIIGVIEGKSAVVDTTTVTPDTSAPNPIQLDLVTNAPGRVSVRYVNPNDPNIQAIVFKASANLPIADSTKTGGGTSYPTLTVQEVVISSLTTTSTAVSISHADYGTSFHTPPTFKATGGDEKRAFVNAYRNANGDEIIFETNADPDGNGCTVTDVRLYIVTFSKWVTTEQYHGAIATAASSFDVTTSPCVPGHTFPLLSTTTASVTEMYGHMFWTLEEPNDTTFRLTTNGTTGTPAAAYTLQLIKSDSLDVQVEDLNMASGDTTTTITLPTAVVAGQAFARYYYRTGTTNPNDIGAALAYITIPTTTSAKATRYTTGRSFTGKVYVGSFKSGWPVTVTQFLLPVAAGDTLVSASIAGHPQTRSFLLGAGQWGRSSITSSSTDSLNSATWSLKLTDSTHVAIERDPTSGAIHRYAGFGLKFPEGGTASGDSAGWWDLVSASGYTDNTDGTGSDRIFNYTNLGNSTQYDLAARVQGKNGRWSTISNSIRVTTPAASGGTNNGDWFVDLTSGSDAAAGTSGAPFKTIQKAVDVMQENDTVRIKGSGTAGAVITKAYSARGVLKAWLGNQPVITMTGSGDSSKTVFDLQLGASGWVFDSLLIVGGGSWITGRGENYNIEIKNCTFNGFLKNWTGIGKAAGLSGNPGFSNWYIHDNYIDAKGSLGTEIGLGRCAIWFSGSAVSKIHIANNTVTRARMIGIGFEHGAHNYLVTGNTISFCKIGIQTNYGRVARPVIQFNTIYGWATHGAHNDHGGAAVQISGADSVLFRGNRIYKDTTVVNPAEPYAINIYGIFGSPGYGGMNWVSPENVRWYRSIGNTIVNNILGVPYHQTSSAALQVAKWADSSQYASQIQLTDLVFINDAYVGFDTVTVYVDNKWTSEANCAAPLTFRNCLFSRYPIGLTGRKQIRLRNTYYTLDSVKTKYPLTFQSSLLDANPVFTDTSTNTFTPAAGSPLINGGTYVSTTATAGTNTNVMKVTDVIPFFDGGGMTQGDLIRAASWGESVRVLGIVGGTLTLEKAMSWSAGEGIVYGSDLTPNIGSY